MVATTTSARAEERTRAQRERILSAARTCFVNSGFHSASMAQIAETAGMSPGLIYRYFESKSAIILAIIENQLEVARGRIRKMRASSDLAAGVLAHCRKRGEAEEGTMSAALFLEMSAEATRDPQIGEALRKFDSAIRGELSRWLARGKDEGGYGLPPAVAEARALMLVCLIGGLKVREAHDVDLSGDLMQRALAEVVSTLVAMPELSR